MKKALIINFLMLITFNQAFASEFEFGSHAENRWNWDYPTQWAALGENCEGKNAGEIIFTVIDPSEIMVVSTLASVGDHLTSGKVLGNIMEPLKLKEDETLVQVLSFQGESACLTVGKKLVVKSEYLIEVTR